MKYITLLAILFSSCSTMKKSKLYGSIAGSIIFSIIGSSIGEELSPDIESNSLNKTIGMATGATIGGIGGYYLGKYFYTSDPRNNEYKPIEFPKQKHQEHKQQLLNNNDIDLSNMSLTKDSDIDIPLLKKLPKSLKEKIQRQKIIKYKVKPQVLKMKDGRQIYFSGGEAIEHKYETAQ